MEEDVIKMRPCRVVVEHVVVTPDQRAKLITPCQMIMEELPPPPVPSTMKNQDEPGKKMILIGEGEKEEK